MSADLVAARKQALVQRASVARLELHREVRMLRASVAARSAGPRFGTARFAIGAALTVTGLFGRNRLASWMRRGLVAANLALLVARYVAPGVRNRTDATARGGHAGPSTGEQP